MFFKAFVLHTLKLELNLSAEISPDLTSLMQQCVSVPPTKFSLRKWKCEVPSLCCLLQDLMFTNQLWNTGSPFAFRHDCEGTTRNLTDQTLNCSSFPWFAFFLLWMPPKPPICCSCMSCPENWAFLIAYHQAFTPVLFGSATFFFKLLVVLIWDGRGRMPVS